MSDDVRRQDGETPDLAPATLAVRAGEGAARAHRGTQVPIVYSAAFAYEDVDTWVDAALGRREGHIYTRNTNPTVAAFEDKVRSSRGRRRPPASPPGWPPSATRCSRCFRPATAW